METVPYYDLPTLLIASTPVAAVVGWTLVRMVQSVFGKPMKLSRKETQQLIHDLQHFKDENAYLSERVDNLETIITSVDPELLESSMRLQSPDFQSSYHKVKKAVNRNHATQARSQPEESLGKNVKSLLNKVVKRLDKAMDEREQRPKTTNRFRF